MLDVTRGIIHETEKFYLDAEEVDSICDWGQIEDGDMVSWRWMESKYIGTARGCGSSGSRLFLLCNIEQH